MSENSPKCWIKIRKNFKPWTLKEDHSADKEEGTVPEEMKWCKEKKYISQDLKECFRTSTIDIQGVCQK